MSLTLTPHALAARLAVRRAAHPQTVAPPSAVATDVGGSPRTVARDVSTCTEASAQATHGDPSGPGDDSATPVSDPEAGMATAEYAIATVAAAGFAGLLVVILRSGEVRELLLGIIRSALSL